jgi:hypothetical protein
VFSSFVCVDDQIVVVEAFSRRGLQRVIRHQVSCLAMLCYPEVPPCSCGVDRPDRRRPSKRSRPRWIRRHPVPPRYEEGPWWSNGKHRFVRYIRCNTDVVLCFSGCTDFQETQGTRLHYKVYIFRTCGPYLALILCHFLCADA